MTRSPPGRSTAPACRRCSTIRRPRTGSWPIRTSATCPCGSRSTSSTPQTCSCTPGTLPAPPARTTGWTPTSARTCWPEWSRWRRPCGLPVTTGPGSRYPTVPNPGPGCSGSSAGIPPGPPQERRGRDPSSAWEGCREAEPGQGAAVKAGHGRDACAGEGQDHQLDGIEAAGLRVAGVEAEGGLAVGPRWYQPGGPARAECCGCEELGGELASLIFQRQWRQGQPDVLGEPGDDAIHVGALKCPAKPVHQPLLGGRAGRWGGLAPR